MSDEIESVTGEALPTLDAIRETYTRLEPHIRKTPVHLWQSERSVDLFGAGTDLFLKCEFLQHTGTFKARGALNNAMAIGEADRQNGVTGVSAGNHAIAVAWAAKTLGMGAKVVMQQSANPARVSAAEALGAEIVFAEDGAAAFARVEEIAREEGRTLIPPFEGRGTVLGTSGVGLEFAEEVPDLDAVLVAIGGGGLGAGVSAAVKLLQPDCEVIGVEPDGADSMHVSFEAGSAQTIPHLDTIADSLAPPMALPYSFAVCRKNIDRLVRVKDEDLRRAMGVLFDDLKLAVEPACAATTAAMMGPLGAEFAGKRVGLILCGSNMDRSTFNHHLEAID